MGGRGRVLLSRDKRDLGGGLESSLAGLEMSSQPPGTRAEFGYR